MNNIYDQYRLKLEEASARNNEYDMMRIIEEVEELHYVDAMIDEKSFMLLCRLYANLTGDNSIISNYEQ